MTRLERVTDSEEFEMNTELKSLMQRNLERVRADRLSGAASAARAWVRNQEQLEEAVWDARAERKMS